MTKPIIEQTRQSPLRRNLESMQASIAAAKAAKWQSPELCDLLDALVKVAIALDERLTALEADELKRRRKG